MLCHSLFGALFVFLLMVLNIEPSRCEVLLAWTVDPVDTIYIYTFYGKIPILNAATF
jgi:hypothetical protein